MTALLLSPALADAGAIARGLMESGREARETAEEAARRLAQTDPMGVDSIYADLDLRGRCAVVRALGAAGTTHAAMVALRHAGDPSPEVFRALLTGLATSGGRALFAPLPGDIPAQRKAAILNLRLRWRTETELVRLKAPAGATGHFTGQFSRLRALGPGIIPVLFDLVRDRQTPLPGEGSSGPYAPLHPQMVVFEKRELRDLAAHAFGEVVRKDDAATRLRLHRLYKYYRDLDRDQYTFEREGLGAALAFSLHDLGDTEPVEDYIAELEVTASSGGYDGMEARWSLGYANIRIGRYDEGEQYYLEILHEPGSTSRHVTAYNLACNFAIRAMGAGNARRRAKYVDLSLMYLEMAIHKFKWLDWQWMEADGDLAFIRKDPRYLELLDELRTKWPDHRKGKVSKKLEDFLDPGKK